MSTISHQPIQLESNQDKLDSTDHSNFNSQNYHPFPPNHLHLHHTSNHPTHHTSNHTNHTNHPTNLHSVEHHSLSDLDHNNHLNSFSNSLPRYTSPLNPNQQNQNQNHLINRQKQNHLHHPSQEKIIPMSNINHPIYHPAPTSPSPILDSDLNLNSNLSNSNHLNLSNSNLNLNSSISDLNHSILSPFQKIHQAWSGHLIANSAIDDRHIKKKRLAYLDGLKFLAALIVLNGTLFDAVLTENDYKLIQKSSPLYIFRSTNLGISMLLILSGRSLIAPLWDPPNPNAKLSKNFDPTKPLVSWSRLTRAMLIRPFRFIFPVISIAALQWGLASGGDHRLTKKCNEAGMTEPYWANIDRLAGLMTLIFDLFTYFEVDTIAGKAFGANLWTVPWFFQSSYAVYVTHFMLGNLPSNRYWVYAILITFSWTSLNYFALPLTGLVIADMAAHGHTAKLRKLNLISRISLRIGLLILAFAIQWIPFIRDHLNSAMSKINVQSHNEITFADWILVSVILFVVETSDLAQTVLSNIFFRIMSKLSAGIYLIAPAIVFTLVPTVALKLHDTHTYQAGGVLGISQILINCFEKWGVDPELAKKDAEDLKILLATGK
ncbi:hypothetical protein O181_064343 [Austropuccinia psidii MF-1]|uniref:Uncharacterized protein n=1 Tax=Austropuccinia psidii MF-1 TaxID=1389203 RepID=A0A9Q3EMU3_9BASI|nr:hypothetical protein [Austropuccinia psidii MF-1]